MAFPLDGYPCQVSLSISDFPSRCRATGWASKLCHNRDPPPRLIPPPSSLQLALTISAKPLCADNGAFLIFGTQAALLRA